jgi:outer membrane lipoprotein-sorting protein
MRSRALILSLLVGVVAAVLVGAVAVAGQSDPLPDIAAPDLMARMAQADGPEAVSGEVAWRNQLFGDVAAASGMAHLPAQSPLTASGSGRIWLSDAGAKVESQGGGGDQVVVVNKAQRTAWIYDYAGNSVRKVVVTGEAPAETTSPAPDAAMLTPDMIGLYLRQVARFATVDVAGQTRVAGREAYQLRMTPVADDTALGYVEAAVDGETMLPLQLDVYAKGGVEPVLRYGFTRVSYDAISPDTFTFTPPEGATVKTKTIDGDELRDQMEARKGDGGDHSTDADKARAEKLVRGALLTRAQVQELVPYELAWARDSAQRPFRWGYVLGNAGPLTASGAPLMQVLGVAAGMDYDALVTTGPHSLRQGAPATGPTSVLLYGDGFGAIALAQTRTTPELEKQLEQARQASEILGSTRVNGAKAIEIGTPLGGVIVWEQDGTTLVAAGMVPMSDLEAFAGSVR